MDSAESLHADAHASAHPICHWKVHGNEEPALGHVADAGIDGGRSGCPLNRMQVFYASVR
ncbi:MAG: hypothetical protein JSS57_25655 [Proteobacteria bacterium]|nr:hypothetical protein [Pseudomonadota bacterium]RTL42330.1 MAG: hypothetical protein EKK49_01060 [Rhodocyclaceae bacterium]